MIKYEKSYKMSVTMFKILINAYIIETLINEN